MYPYGHRGGDLSKLGQRRSGAVSHTKVTEGLSCIDNSIPVTGPPHKKNTNRNNICIYAKLESVLLINQIQISCIYLKLNVKYIT